MLCVLCDFVVKNNDLTSRVEEHVPACIIVLVEPEIPPNTGNIARLCAGNDVPLHLVGPLGFKIDDKHLRRAGLDYWPSVRPASSCRLRRIRAFGGASAASTPARIFGFARPGRASPYTEIRFQPGDAILFGSESRGLPAGDPGAMRRSDVRVPHVVRQGIRSLKISPPRSASSPTRRSGNSRPADAGTLEPARGSREIRMPQRLQTANSLPAHVRY